MPISRQYALAGVEKSVSASDRLCRKAVPLPFFLYGPGLIRLLSYCRRCIRCLTGSKVSMCAGSVAEVGYDR